MKTQKKVTYKMLFECSNCHVEEWKQVRRGQRAGGQGGVCSYCGVRDKAVPKKQQARFSLPSPSWLDVPSVSKGA